MCSTHFAANKIYNSYTSSWSRLVAWLNSAAALFKLVCAFLLLSCKSDLFGFSGKKRQPPCCLPTTDQATGCTFLSAARLLWPTQVPRSFSEIVALMREEPRPPPPSFFSLSLSSQAKTFLRRSRFEARCCEFFLPTLLWFFAHLSAVCLERGRERERQAVFTFSFAPRTVCLVVVKELRIY